MSLKASSHKGKAQRWQTNKHVFMGNVGSLLKTWKADLRTDYNSCKVVIVGRILHSKQMLLCKLLAPFYTEEAS